MSTRAMVAAERRDLAAFLRTLDDEDWATPSLCVGWTVREVAAHVAYDALPAGTYVGSAIRAGLRIDRLNALAMKTFADVPNGELVDRLEASAERGLGRRVAPRITLADTLVHHQDIRRPLGKPREIPEDRLRAALTHPDPFARPWRYRFGLRLVATDIVWSKGNGPEVRGPGEALALAITGRSVALDELDGDGLPLLRERLGPIPL